MKTPLLLIGGGGHCRSCIDVIEATQQFEIVGIVEANGVEPDAHSPYPCVGHDADLPKLLEQTPHCLITVGQVKSAQLRQRLFSQLTDLGAIFPTIIAPTAYVSATAKIGAGTIVMHQAMVNAYAQIGNNVIINSQALVEHDCTVADHTHISTGAKVNGEVHIGEGCLIGSHATLKQCITLADQTLIGAGSLVLTDIKSPKIYTGVVK